VGSKNTKLTHEFRAKCSRVQLTAVTLVRRGWRSRFCIKDNFRLDGKALKLLLDGLAVNVNARMAGVPRNVSSSNIYQALVNACSTSPSGLNFGIT
jgi:hypothetical protein